MLLSIEPFHNGGKTCPAVREGILYQIPVLLKPLFIKDKIPGHQSKSRKIIYRAADAGFLGEGASAKLQKILIVICDFISEALGSLWIVPCLGRHIPVGLKPVDNLVEGLRRGFESLKLF